MTDLGGLGYGVSPGFGINATRGGRRPLVPGTDRSHHGAPAEAHVRNPTPRTPFSWIAGSMTDLGALGGAFSEARAVNRNGDIVGGSNSDAFLVHSGKMSNLGPGEALGINDFGEIAGGLDGQPHSVDAAALAPAVADFFGAKR